MKAIRTDRKRSQATILLVALVVLGVGTLGMTSWVYLIYARMGQSDALENAAIRRVRLENSRAVAREHVFRQVVTKDSGTAKTIDLPDSWGSIAVPAWNGAPMNSNALGSFNQFGPSPYQTYETSLTLGLGDGVSTHNYDFKVRSNVPHMQGDIFTMHKPTLAPNAANRIQGNINVYGRAVLYSDLDVSRPQDFNDLDAERYLRPENGVTDFDVSDPNSGSTVMMDNYPVVATTNAEIGTGADYTGMINVVDGGATNAENSIFENAVAAAPIYIDGDDFRAWSGGVACNGNGRVYVDLDNPFLNAVVISDVFRIYLYGQGNAAQAATASTMDPLIICYRRWSGSQRDLYSIRCFDENRRKTVMGVKKNPSGVETYMFFYDSVNSPPPIWRVTMVAENTKLRTVNVWGGSVDFTGGIQTDRKIRHTGWYSFAGAFNIRPETDFSGLLPFAARSAWLESYAQ